MIKIPQPSMALNAPGSPVALQDAHHLERGVTTENIKQLGGSGCETPYHIDGFEGLTRQWAPDGAVTWEHEYARWPLQSVLFGPN